MLELRSSCDGRVGEVVHASTVDHFDLYVKWWELLCLGLGPGESASLTVVSPLEGKQPQQEADHG